jgi:hypothetical protein
MNRSSIFKVIAITNFILLFTIFLLYRNGSFNDYFYKNTDNNFTSPNGGVGARQTADSVKAAYDSLRALQQMRMSSSKSLVVTDFRYSPPSRKIPKKDSTPVKPTDIEKDMMLRSKPDMMYSSKSGMIIEPKMFILDSLLKKREKQKKQQ